MLLNASFRSVTGHSDEQQIVLTQEEISLTNHMQHTNTHTHSRKARVQDDGSERRAEFCVLNSHQQPASRICYSCCCCLSHD